MGFFFDHYPYTNLHNVNLDWVLQAVKAWGNQVENLGRQFNSLQEAWIAFKDETNQMIEAEINDFNDAYEIDKAQLQVQYQQFTSYVTNYLNNLDYENVIQEYLANMVSSGELRILITPTVTNAVTDWLNNNITPTTPLIDKTLSVSGAGADAREVGTKFNTIDNSLNSIFNNTPISYDVIQNNTPTRESINLTWNGYNNFSLNGVPDVSTDTLFVNILGSTSAIPQSITKGRTYYFKLECDNTSIFPTIWVKHSDDTTESLHDSNIRTNAKIVGYTVKQSDKAIIFRFGVPKNGSTPVTASGSLYITTDYYTPYINANIANIESEINRRLNKFGLCIFEKGNYTISTSITMPDNTKIMGFGNSTTIYYSGTGSCFIMGHQCHIRDLMINGANSDITLPTYENIENKHAIEWSGENKQFGVITNCLIQRFGGSAIYALDTSTPVDHNLTITDCQIRNCCIGVYIRRNSEFIKITGCTIARNTIGILNRGGNNIIANCGIDGNVTNILINEDEGHNSGHGAITNCSINHADSNNGYGIIINGTGRMLISNCNFYYSKIKMSGGNGNIINGCGFGNLAIIEIDEGESYRCDIITNCMMKDTNNVINVLSGATKVSNCWTRAGQVVDATIVTP